jgi:hypothetical protein
MIVRDPGEKPQVTPGLIEFARDLDRKLVQVICQPPNAKVGDPGGVNFMALTDFLPRIGDIIETEDLKHCRVNHVVHRVVPFKDGNKTKAFGFLHIVGAVLVDPDADEQ